MSRVVFLLNGPNLNLLGRRQPAIYGRETLAEVETQCQDLAQELGLQLDCRQSNSEAQLIEWIQEARERASGIIINAAALTHTSVAILDALLACDCPIFEVHISNIHQRESFRHHSYVSAAATGVILGFGTQGYQLALQRLARLLNQKKSKKKSKAAAKSRKR